MKSRHYQICQLLLDLFLRVAGLAGKFLLFIVIAKYFDDSAMGEYGLITGLLAMMLYIVGMDFYTYSTREIIHKKIEIWTSLYNQMFFYALNYVLLFFFWKWVTHFSGISNYLVLIFILLIFEHLSQELYRILIVLEKITAANIQLFIRIGLWCYICIGLLFFDMAPTSLEFILQIWLMFVFISVLFALYCIQRAVPIKFRYLKLEFQWLKKGLKVASVFFIGTLFLRTIFYFDKIIINHYSNLQLVGIYVFYIGIINAVQSVLDVLVISRYYPSLVASVGKLDHLVSAKRRMMMHVLVQGGGLFLLSIPACWIVVRLLGKSGYEQMFYLYPLLCVAWLILNISMVYHYVLFGLKKDNYILLCNIFVFAVFFILFFGLIQLTDHILISVAVSFFSSYTLLLLLKQHKVNKLLEEISCH